MRYHDWPERLAQYLDDRRDTPFAWRANDCASFASGAVFAQRGEWPIELDYADEFGALRFARDGGGIRAIADATLGASIHPAYAQRGDIVLCVLDGRETLGVCVGHEVAGPSRDGMVTVPIETAVAAWRV